MTSYGIHQLLWICLYLYTAFAESPIQLTQVVKPEESTFTLSCKWLGMDFTLMKRFWFRNGQRLFSSECNNENEAILSVQNQTAFDWSIGDRVNLTCNDVTHNVTLRINVTIDEGSDWSCGYSGSASNSKLVIDLGGNDDETTSSTTTSTPPTTSTTTTVQSATFSSRENHDDRVTHVGYIVAGIVAGTILLTGVILTVLYCRSRHRRHFVSHYAKSDYISDYDYHKKAVTVISLPRYRQSLEVHENDLYTSTREIYIDKDKLDDIYSVVAKKNMSSV